MLTGCLIYQLRKPILADDADTGVPTVGQDLSAVASIMSPAALLADHFPLPLPLGNLHTIVEAPNSCKSSGLSRGGSLLPLCNQ
jgi:hypothetical protein